MTIKSVLIAGAGAVGLTVADTLAAYSESEVRVLAGGSRLERYRREGLTVNGRKLPIQLAPAGIPADSFEPELIIVACKFHHLNQIMEDFAPYVTSRTTILSLLNGISSENIIRRRFPSAKVPLAMILGTDAQHSGTETTYSQKGVIHFGEGKNPVNGAAVTAEQAAGCSDTVRIIAAYFDAAGLPFEIPADMEQRMWFKFMVNTGINQCSAVLGKPYAPFQHDAPDHPSANAAARRLMENAMREVIAVAQAEGIMLDEPDIAGWYKTLDALTPGSRTSMCQDVQAGRKTEVELFAGTVISLAAKHGIAVPVNRMLMDLITVIEETYGV